MIRRLNTVTGPPWTTHCGHRCPHVSRRSSPAGSHKAGPSHPTLDGAGCPREGCASHIKGHFSGNAAFPTIRCDFPRGGDCGALTVCAPRSAVRCAGGSADPCGRKAKTGRGREREKPGGEQGGEEERAERPREEEGGKQEESRPDGLSPGITGRESLLEAQCPPTVSSCPCRSAVPVAVLCFSACSGPGSRISVSPEMPVRGVAGRAGRSSAASVARLPAGKGLRDRKTNDTHESV